MNRFFAIFFSFFAVMGAADVDAQTYRYVGPAGDEKVIDISVVGAVPSADYYKEVNDAMLRRQWPGGLSLRMDSLMGDPLLETMQVGLMVYDLTADRPLYRRGERQLLRPASTMKLLTGITALTVLPDNYRYTTRLYYGGTLKNGILDGDIYCVGGMDPMIDGDDLNELARQIAARGVKTIRGRIVADNSLRDTKEEEFGEGWCWDDDNPTLSPLLFNRKDGFCTALVKALRRANVNVNATVVGGTLPVGSVQPLASVTHTIDEVMVDMMKESDNLYAESMFYQLAAAEGKRPARGKMAAERVGEMIDRIMPYEATYRIADGSGLSLYNYVTADIEVGLLRHAWQNKRVFNRLLPTLPIAGVDGTLKKRMIGTPAYRNVRAKTGTLTGIYSLAGYCTASNGHTIAFAIITQGSMQGRPARDFMDKVCGLLCDSYE